MDLDDPAADAWETPLPLPPAEKPRLRIPGDDRLVSSFARELGQHLAQAGLFNLAGQPVIENDQRNGLNPLSPAKFITWIEEFVNCFRMKGENAINRSISTADA